MSLDIFGDLESDWKKSGGTVIPTPAVEAEGKVLAERARQMSRLKNATVSTARALLTGGQAAIDDATRTAWVSKMLPATWRFHPFMYFVSFTAKVMVPPQSAARQKVYFTLKWHQDRLDEMAKTPDAAYPHLDDLKKWVLQAFIEKNVASGEAEYLARIWSEMWDEIGKRIQEVAARIGQVAAAPFLLIEKALTVPWWAWAIGGTILAGTVGVIGYKVLVPVGAAAIRGYLPARSSR